LCTAFLFGTNTNVIPDRHLDSYIHIDKETIHHADTAVIHIIHADHVTINAKLLNRTETLLTIEPASKSKTILNGNNVKKVILNGKNHDEGTYKLHIEFISNESKDVLIAEKQIYFVGKLHNEVINNLQDLRKKEKAFIKKCKKMSSYNLLAIYLYNFTDILNSLPVLNDKPEYSTLVFAQKKLSEANLLAELLSKKTLTFPDSTLTLSYVSRFDSKVHSFDLLVPGISAKKRRPSALKPLVYITGKNGISIKNIKNTGQKAIWTKFHPSQGYKIKNTDFDSLFSEYQSIIEMNVPVNKTRIYLISHTAHAEALYFYNRHPTKYAAISMLSDNNLQAANLQKNLAQIPSGYTPDTQIIFCTDKEHAEGYKNIKNIITQVIRYEQSKITDCSKKEVLLNAAEKYFSKRQLGKIPRELSFSSDDISRYNRLYYIDVHSVVTPGKIAELTFKLKRNKTIDIKTDNIEDFTIDLTYPVFPRNNRVEIYINGKVAFNEIITDQTTLTFKSEGYKYLFR
jgi:hypothetical protein